MKLKTKLPLLSKLTRYGSGTLSFCKQYLYVHCTLLYLMLLIIELIEENS